MSVSRKFALEENFEPVITALQNSLTNQRCRTLKQRSTPLYGALVAVNSEAVSITAAL
jgi:hypothetical protein